MDPKIIVRTLAVILLGGSVLACAVDLARRDPESKPPPPATDDTIDPLAAELGRCKVLGAEVADDTACKAAWAKSRERFFAPGVPYQGRLVDPFPATPDSLAPRAPSKIHLDRAPSAPQPNAGSTLSTDSEGR